MDADNHYEELLRQMKVIKDRVRGVVYGQSNGVYLHGRPGTSKTYMVGEKWLPVAAYDGFTDQNSPGFTAGDNQSMYTGFEWDNERVAWNPSSSSVVGYNVYRGTNTGGPYSQVNTMNASTIYTDNSVQAGQTYFYVTTAVDGTGKESPYSNQTQAAVPTP